MWKRKSKKGEEGVKVETLFLLGVERMDGRVVVVVEVEVDVVGCRSESASG